MFLVHRVHGWARRSRPAVKHVGLILSSCIVWMSAGGASTRQGPEASIPAELQPYVNVRSIANQHQAELIRQYPELEEVDFAQSQEGLPFLLEKVGEGVEAFFRDFVNVSSIESIDQEVGNPPEARDALDSVVHEHTGVRIAVPRTLHHRCNYLIVARTDEKGITLEEYRTNNKGERIELASSYLLTSGFVSLPLYFHPRYQTGCLFRYLGRETKDRRLVVLGFAQRPETTELIGSFHLMGRAAVILTQGIAWVDPDTFQIVRMRTDLLAPRADIWLARQTSEIELGEVSFEGVQRPLWLPRKVAVTMEWHRTVYRNQHRYRNYKLFSVETREDKKEIVQPQKQIP